VVTSVAKKAKTRVFKEHKLVLIFCPRISECRSFCLTYRRYEKQNYDIVCLNPSYYRVGDTEKILAEELKKRSELKNRLGF